MPESKSKRSRYTPPPPKKAPPTLCPVTPAEGALPLDKEGANQDQGNPFADVPDEAGDAPRTVPLSRGEEDPF